MLTDRMMRYAALSCPNTACLSEALARLQRDPDLWKCRLCGTVFSGALFDPADIPSPEEEI